MLALCDDVSEEAAREKAVESSQKHAARTTLRGVNWRSPGYMASVGFRHLNVYSHLVHDLDAAIDMHISLVRLRQGVCDQLIAGIDHYQALRHGLDTMDAERRAAGLVKMRLRFNTYYRGKKTPRTQDLDEVVRQWANAEQQFAQAQLARKEKKRKLEQIRAELTQQKQTEREHQKKDLSPSIRSGSEGEGQAGATAAHRTASEVGGGDVPAAPAKSLPGLRAAGGPAARQLPGRCGLCLCPATFAWG
ncbi:unnamed protein product [Effrenium voratum]|nr:unnamed protein product [Effrenium voratum]